MHTTPAPAATPPAYRYISRSGYTLISGKGLSAEFAGSDQHAIAAHLIDQERIIDRAKRYAEALRAVLQDMNPEAVTYASTITAAKL